jgi:lipopolysaccharide transport system permease protein
MEIAESAQPDRRTAGGAVPHYVIEPTHGWAAPRLRELWQHRELLYFLVWRDVKVRYKQTALGAAWAVLQPFMTMVVFSIFFGRLAGVPSDGMPYPIFAYTALLPWQLFAHSLAESGNSLVTNQDLVKKVYFPRLVIPLSSVLAGLVDFAVAFLVLLAMMYYYGIVPGLAVLALPVFVLLACVAALAAGLWLAALNVEYRDVRYTIPFLTQFWLFVTPIAYSTSLVPDRWRVVYGLNPMVAVVEGFRWALLGSSDALTPAVGVSVIMTVLLLIGGLFYFRRVEKTFADIV